MPIKPLRKPDIRPTALRRRHWALLTLLLAMVVGCGTPPTPAVPIAVVLPTVPAAPLEPRVLETKAGLASYYHPSLHGLETASGVPYDDTALMAAHPTYPLGTVARVVNLENDSSVEVSITDRGPSPANVAEGVIIDLSGAAARALGMMEVGRVQVKVEVVYWGADERKRQTIAKEPLAGQEPSAGQEPFVNRMPTVSDGASAGGQPTAARD